MPSRSIPASTAGEEADDGLVRVAIPGGVGEDEAVSV